MAGIARAKPEWPKPRPDWLCWDSSVFLAHLKEEQDKREYLPAIKDCLLKAAAGEITICASALMTCEVRESRLTEEAKRWLRELRFQPWFVSVSMDDGMLDLAGDVRDASQALGRKMITTPDAIHVAATIAAGCESLWTFDGLSPSKGSEAYKLLECDAKLEPWRTRIRLPGVGSQRPLFEEG